MSTRLLSVQGKVHELNDDLESHFFVLLYQALHFVEHNQPDDIFPDTIFDQVHVDPKTGNHTGGQGKASFYATNLVTMNEQLEFASKPFTTLVRGLYQIFTSLQDYHCAKSRKKNPDESDVKNIKQLEDCVGIVALLDEALKSKEWPTECDKVPDQYPPSRRLSPEQKDIVALSHLNESVATRASSGKRKLETEGEPSGPRRSSRHGKRSKADQHR